MTKNKKNKFNTIAIVGIGLIGGSIGLAVKKKNLADKVIGIGRRKSSLKKALDKKTVDKITLDKSRVKDADLIILSVPVGKIVPLIKELVPYFKKGTVITDVGSTKKEITDKLKNFLPKGINFIGGHPMAGSEKSGVEAASAKLFEKSVCFLVPCKNTDASLKKLGELWKQLGAKPIVISAQEHDFLVAGISHLPHIAAIALVNSVYGIKCRQREITEFAGQGWKDTTRISRGSPEIWADIFYSNADKILLFMEKFSKEWEKIEKALCERNYEKILKTINRKNPKSP